MENDQFEKNAKTDEQQSLETQQLVEDSVDLDLNAEYADPTEAEIDDVGAEIERGRKYGSQGATAAIEGFSRGATIGLSDVALTAAGQSAEDIKARKELNPIISGVSEAAGTIASLVSPAGPAAAVVRGGKLAEKAVEQGLKQVLKGTGKQSLAKSLARSIAPTAAAGAVEGAAFGAGELLSENALGDAELNAETLKAYVGTGALLGGGLNTAFLGASKAIPAAGRGVKKVWNATSKSLGDVTDPVAAAKKLSGMTPSQIVKLEKNNPMFFENLPDYLRDDLKLGVRDTADDIAIKNSAVLDAAGERIGQLSKEFDAASKEFAQFVPPRASTFDDMISAVQSNIDELSTLPGSSRAEIQGLKSIKNDLISIGAKEEALTFGELNDLRKMFDKKAKFNPQGQVADNVKANMYKELRGIARQKTDQMADILGAAASGSPLSVSLQELKKQNRLFHTARTLEDTLLKRAERGAANSFLPDFKETLAGHLAFSVFGPLGAAAAAGLKAVDAIGGGDVARKVIILGGVSRMKEQFNIELSQGIKNFFSKSTKVARPVSQKIMINSFLGSNPQTNEPAKDKKTAFKNVTQNLADYNMNPEKFMNKVVKGSTLVSQAAPQISQALTNKTIAAVQFLGDKWPKQNDESGASIFHKRPYEPSSLELAKAERYLQAIEAPLSLLDDLEKGTLTSEHVEALKAVYPSIYKQMQEQVMAYVMNNEEGSELPYKKRLQLGLLLDVPTDESLTPAAILGLQSAFQTQPEPPQQGSYSASQVGSSEKADRTQSGMEKTLNRRS